jgi:ATP-binding cassette, subfamily B, multidrug efflux pump
MTGPTPGQAQPSFSPTGRPRNRVAVGLAAIAGFLKFHVRLSAAPRNPYLWQMRPYFRRVGGLLVIGSLAGIAMNTFVVLPAILLGRAIDATRAFEAGRGSSAEVGWAALALVAGTFATEIPRIIKRYWLAVVCARIRSDIRLDALRGVLSWPMERLHQAPVGDLMARIIGDVEVLNVGVREFTIETWDTILFSLSLVVVMFVYDAQLTLLVLLSVPPALLLALGAGRWVSRRTTIARETNGTLTSFLQEQFAGIRVLRLFGRSAWSVERFATLSWNQRQANLATTRLQVGLKPVYGTLMTAGVLLLIWKGGERVVGGAMTVGALIGYLALYTRFITRAPRIPQMFNSIQSGGAAFARLKPLLAPPLPLAGEPPRSSFAFQHVAGSRNSTASWGTGEGGAVQISLEDVTFRYPGTDSPALRHFTLSIPAGAFVGVTGPVGSGKSALARALVGLYPLDGGRILQNGKPVDPSASNGEVLMGYLPQDPQLFTGTVLENLLAEGTESLGSGGESVETSANGRKELREGIERSIALTALEPDLRGLPLGIETEIGELGVRVSGGQRQRIALARALSAGLPRRPGLLVLDDPFSSVDVNTEVAIIKGLLEAFGPAAAPADRSTIVLCSHRLTAFPQADLVVVLNEGCIEEQGSHASLIAKNGLYARIYRAQGRAADAANGPGTK